MSFKIGEKEDYAFPFPDNEPPVKIGHFSTNNNNEFCDDNHQMKYLSMPKDLRNLHLDLNEGFSEFIGVYRDEEHFYNKLLRWIVSHKEEVKNLLTEEDASKRKIDFVCRRGVLTAINSTFYEPRDWQIYATKFRSIIYLCKMETETYLKIEASRTERQRKTMSWGYKIAQYLTSESIKSEPSTSQPVNVNEKYYVVIKRKLEDHGLLFCSETDAVDPQYLDHDGDSSMDRFVEIRTASSLAAENVDKYFRWTLLKWHMYCFTAGIPRLICGLRDKNGVVREIKSYNISDLPQMVEGVWSSDVCLNFGTRFLNYVKESVIKDDPRVVYKFYYKPGAAAVTCEELSLECQFLPEWYIKEMSL